MRISIASYAFHGLFDRDMLNVFGYLESLRFRYHLDCADIWNGMLKGTDEPYLRKVREAIDEKELSLANLCCDACQAWDSSPEARERYRQNAIAHLKAAVILGAKTVRFDFGGQEPEMTEEQFDWTVDRFREYAEFATENGFCVVAENHYGPARVLSNQLRVAEAVNNRAYGVLLHFGSWVADPDECNKAIAPWVMHTHIDAKHCSRDVEEVLQPLFDTGYQGCYSVEHHSGQNEYAEVAVQLARVRRVLLAKGVR